ncbi:MAG: universal stress protein [Pseudonocardiaceae bacterium]|nr:universal stress protein [Pseudonocardiaceae bacterium]
MNENRNAAPVVAGVDGSRSALRAVRWAAAEAVRRDVPLRLVHAYVIPTRGYPERIVTVRQVRTGLEKQSHDWLQEAATAAAAVAGVRVESRPVIGETVRALVTESRDAALMVVGTRGLGGFTGLLLGSNAAALARHGHCPVLVVRGETPDDEVLSTRPVLVGVDGSPASDTALGFAYREAAIRGVPLVAVHAWCDVTSDVTERVYDVPVDWEELDAELRGQLDDQLAAWEQKYPDVPLRRVPVRGRAARTLLAQGRQAQLIVVGVRGAGGFAGMLLGSTSRALIYHAPCPVAVVRPVPEA